jgi:hypothetical protein
VSPLFAILSGAGFLVAFLMASTRFVMTRPRRRSGSSAAADAAD